MTFKVFTIAAALGLAASTASAQGTSWLGNAAAYSDDQYRAPYSDVRRVAYDNGYRDGVKRGEQAARDGRQFDVERERDYRSAESGYNRAYGDRARYRDDYRGGFQQGYRDGYGRRAGGSGYPSQYPQYPSQYPSQYPGTYPRDSRGGILGGVLGGYGRNGNDGYYGRTSGYGAYQNGAGDGYKKGLEDLDKRRAPDVTRHQWYRSGDHDYERAYGSKDAYRNEYRRGFADGYNRAFREGRRY